MRYYYKDIDGNYYSLKEPEDGLLPITREEFEEHEREGE